MNKRYSFQWLALAVLFVFVLSACGAGSVPETPVPVPTETQMPLTATIPAMGRINGRVEFQAPPTPATVLYVVNEVDPSQWFTRDLAGSESSTPFEIEVPAGNYLVYARQADGPMVAAYLNADESLGTITVPAGDVVNGVLLRFAAPQTLCQRVVIPASPDGRFTAVEATECPVLDAPSETAATDSLATIRGTITYQAPPVPNSMVYFVSNERWYYFEVVGGDMVATFEWQVEPGTYTIVAYPIGSETADFRRPAAYSPDGGIGYLTLTARQVVENISLHNVNSDMCISVPFPVSPDGRFPALEKTCN